MRGQQQMEIRHLRHRAAPDPLPVDQMRCRCQNLTMARARADLRPAQQEAMLWRQTHRAGIAEHTCGDLDGCRAAHRLHPPPPDPKDRLRSRIQRAHPIQWPQRLHRARPVWRGNQRPPRKADERLIHRGQVNSVILHPVPCPQSDRCDVVMMGAGRDRIIHQPRAPSSICEQRHLNIEAGVGLPADHHSAIGVKCDLLRIEDQRRAENVIRITSQRDVIDIMIIDDPVPQKIPHRELNIARRINRAPIPIRCQVILTERIPARPYLRGIPSPSADIGHTERSTAT